MSEAPLTLSAGDAYTWVVVWKKGRWVGTPCPWVRTRASAEPAEDPPAPIEEPLFDDLF